MSNSKRKILFLIESLDSGDAGKALSTLVQYIDKTTYDVTVCSINAGGQYESIIRENVNYKAILTGEGGMKHKMVYKNLPMSMVYKFYVPQGSDVEIAYSEGFATKLLSCSSNKKAKSMHGYIQICIRIIGQGRCFLTLKKKQTYIIGLIKYWGRRICFVKHLRKSFLM